MKVHDWLAKGFDENRSHLRGVAYRMLGSLAEADDAVQEAWLKVSRADTTAIDNLGGWLTTVVARVCLDMLRSRKARREDPLISDASTSGTATASRPDPEHEAVMADSVGLALLVVLDTLSPPERLAFVLHDMFAVPFEEIAHLVGRSPQAARQLASRARRRVQGPRAAAPANISAQRQVVDAFLAALRNGDFEALVAVLDPDLVVHADATAAAPRGVREIRGARTWAQGAMAYRGGIRFAQPALVDGAAGVVVAPRGRLFRVLRLTIANGKITGIEVVGDPGRLAALDLAVIEDQR